MKFSHLADCHIGSWKDEKLNTLSTEAFLRAMDISKEEHVEFILIAGDIFNTALPAIDKLKAVTKKLREVKERDISVYIIPGSHDFSPSGKTILDVLEHAGLLINVVKGAVVDNKLQLRWTEDKSGAKITGMFGKKGSLEKKYYDSLDIPALEAEQGFKIFMFHSPIAELKPAELYHMDAAPLSYLPRYCNYYAGGHVHAVQHASFETHQNIVYPGPLFPNSFSELEKLKHGGFFMYDNGAITFKEIIIHPVQSIIIYANHESAAVVYGKLKEQCEKISAENAIIAIRVIGELSEGKTADIDFKAIKEMLEQKGAWHVMKSTSQLKAKEFQEIRITGSTADIEERIIDEHASQFQGENQKELTKMFLKILNTEKLEGERIVDFENRVRKDVEEIMKF
jgi:DNA repair exonuclease SbcCD nuclease subunit